LSNKKGMAWQAPKTAKGCDVCPQPFLWCIPVLLCQAAAMDISPPPWERRRIRFIDLIICFYT
jgi:hypothetical protein